MKPLRSIHVVFILSLLVLAVPGYSGWVTDGAPVCDATGDQEYMEMTADGNGGAIITWADRRGYPDIYAQRIDQNGDPAWTADGIVVCGYNYAQYLPQIISDGSGGAIIAWYDGRPYPERDIYVQRIDASGSALWTADGVAVCTAAADQEYVELCGDGLGGAFLVWVDERSGTMAPKDIYAQYVDWQGNVVWTADGVPICTVDLLQDLPKICPDGSGGAYITWLDYRAGTHIYAQRINAAGAVQWAADGIAVCNQPGTKYDLEIMADGAGNAILAWCDNRTWYDLYAQKIDASGNSLWTANGQGVCVAPEQQRYPQMIPDGSGGAIITWRDNRDTQTDIYVRRVDNAGDTLWNTNGVLVCYQADSQFDPYIAPDGANGAIIAWYDFRGAIPDIYSQRIGSDGSVLWAADGVAVCTADNTQRNVRVVTDGRGGAIYAWEDERTYVTTGKDVYYNGLDQYGSIKVPTTLAAFTAEATETGITVRWRLSETGGGVEFFVYRAESRGGVFRHINNASIGRTGLLYEFVDDACVTGRIYHYRVDVSDDKGRRTLFETGPVSLPPTGLSLEQNTPNPFNPGTTIRFVLPSQTHVNLSVFDARGERVATVVDGIRSGGPHAIVWNGRDDSGAPVSSGVYFYRLEAGKNTLTRKMVVIK